MMMPIIGKPAPLFTAESTIGPISLEQCQGRAVILYFYPKDNTPGCTTESQDFRDLHADFLSASAVVVGISRDSLKSHENFKAKMSFLSLSSPTPTKPCATCTASSSRRTCTASRCAASSAAPF